MASRIVASGDTEMIRRVITSAAFMRISRGSGGGRSDVKSCAWGRNPGVASYRGLNRVSRGLHFDFLCRRLHLRLLGKRHREHALLEVRLDLAFVHALGIAKERSNDPNLRSLR